MCQPLVGKAASSERRVDSTGVTRAIYNARFSSTGTTPAHIADSFLRTNKDELQLSNEKSQLTITETKATRNASHVRYRQTYEGLPVHDGELIVSIDAHSHVSMVINNIKSNIRTLIPTKRIGDAAAWQVVRNTLPTDATVIGDRQTVPLMVWQDKAGEYHIAYRVRLTTENPSGDWEAFVDASSGKILSMENRFANSNRHQGSGNVYLTDPLSAAKKRYGAAGFTDNNDADSDSLTHYLTLVTLDSLTFEDGVYKLKGPYCEITDLESPIDPLFYSEATPHAFTYTRSRQEFEAVNAYYHITQSYKYIESLGFSSASLQTVRVDPHGLSGQDNSHYSPNGNWIAMGEGGIDDAEDVDVILHEYAHAIVFNSCPSWGGGESGALGEGYSDYWAASSSRIAKGWQPTDYEYNWVFNWNSHNIFQLGRSLNDTRTYPFGNLGIYEAGQIWSSTLMSIWNDLGRETTDKLVLQSLNYLGAGATGVDAAQALLQADRDLFGGAHLSTLVYLLGTVKHFIDPQQYAPSIVHTQLADISLSNWPATVNASISQANAVESMWVEYKINSGDLRTFPMSANPSGQFSGTFDLPAAALRVGDTIQYRICFRYGLNRVSTDPMNEYFSFRVLSRTTDVASNVAATSFSLSQNYPNPFNPTTTISFEIPEQSRVLLSIYNAIGQQVAVLFLGEQNAGTFTATWNGRNDAGSPVASGTYVYRLVMTSSNGAQQVLHRKLTLLR
ncbi:MAG: T9SS type A sorting domain-containing protein [Ignavibacteriae bacterium]|nr:T9SS type A sorting domain-containing protein [Ignavibacteriota bacterium]